MTSRPPLATYRLQFNPSFLFRDATSLVPYLHDLGISHLYASPIFQARPGSTHGYDVTNPLALNPELGTRADFDALVAELQAHGMGLVLDIVPNHMAAGPDNPWWTDLLENGATSPYARFFDVDWRAETGGRLLQGKVLVPILGGTYGEILERGELQVGYDRAGFHLAYWDNRLPIDPGTYGRLLNRPGADRHAGGPTEDEAFDELAEIALRIARLPPRYESDPPTAAHRRQEAAAIKRELWALYSRSAAIRSWIDANLRAVNGHPGDPHSFDRLDDLLGEQVYEVAFWRLAARKINYRRFFDINELVGVRVEDPAVFEATHAFVLQLIRERKAQGLRIDHVDGLHDPLGYLERLQAAIREVLGDGATGAADEPFWLVVEKILVGDETLRAEWPVAGTTGYDFLNHVNLVLVDRDGVAAIDRTYHGFTGDETTFADLARAKKRWVMEQLFPGETRALGAHLTLLGEDDRHGRDVVPEEFRHALVAATGSFPVYRTYVRRHEVDAEDEARLEGAIEDGRQHNPAIAPEAFQFLRRVLRLDYSSTALDETRDSWLRFVMRWQQFTGPIMAKSLEDTTFYLYNRLVSLNEVGGDPVEPDTGRTIEGFHERMQARARDHPHTMNASSTHDTKRSEDVRARISVLSEIPAEWEARLVEWSAVNAPRKRVVDDIPVPDASQESLLYQVLLGAWPLHGAEVPEFHERVKTFMTKAAREGKTHTSWVSPNEAHEAALVAFIDRILEPGAANPFLESFRIFQQRVAFHGMLNALSQTLLKITAPGLPDFYQGTEVWDLSLTDPDNRRPVDYAKRRGLLASFREESPSSAGLLEDWRDGRIKSFLVWRALACRARLPKVFSDGAYRPLAVEGMRANNVIAFAREHGGAAAITIVPRLTTAFAGPARPAIGADSWGDTAVCLPASGAAWRDAFTGTRIKPAEGTPLAVALGALPFALLVAEAE